MNSTGLGPPDQWLIRTPFGCLKLKKNFVFLQQFQIPDEFQSVHLYLDAWYQTDVYKETEYADEEIIDSWKEKRGANK